jgi:hypothetical protein
MANHGTISTLARSAAFSANLLGGIGRSLVAWIFSITRSVEGFDKLFIGLNR